MTISFTSRMIAGLLAVTLIQPAFLPASDSGLNAWQNLRQLTAGQDIEVIGRDHKSVRGSFVAFSDQSISLHRKQRDVTMSRSDVVQVRRRSAKSGSHMLIGAAIGGGAGAGIGAGIGESVGNESGGDFNNLKPAIIGICAAVGILVGVLIGSVAGNRHTTIYAIS